MKELEKALRMLDGETLAVLIPSFYYEALEMASDEADLFGYTTPEDVAINAYFDNLQDGDKYDALQQVSELILNLLGIMQTIDDETLENLLNIARGDF